MASPPFDSTPTLLSCNLGQPPGVVTLQSSMPLLAATLMSRTTLSMHAGQESLLPPQAHCGHGIALVLPLSVQMGSPSPIASAGDLTPMQVDAVLLFHPNPPCELHLWQAVAFRIVQNKYDGVVPPSSPVFGLFLERPRPVYKYPGMSKDQSFSVSVLTGLNPYSCC